MADVDIREPDAQEREIISKGLAWAVQQRPRPDGRLTPADLQAIYDLLLDEPGHGEAIVACGVTFGAMLCRQPGYAWYSLKGATGRKLLVGKAWGPGERFVFCGPVNIIREKAAAGERLQVEQLLDETIRGMEREIASRKANG